MSEVYAVQVFDGEVWTTVQVSTMIYENVQEYMQVKDEFAGPVRAVRFRLPSLDVLATHCTDFAVLALRPAKPS